MVGTGYQKERKGSTVHHRNVTVREISPAKPVGEGEKRWKLSGIRRLEQEPPKRYATEPT